MYWVAYPKFRHLAISSEFKNYALNTECVSALGMLRKKKSSFSFPLFNFSSSEPCKTSIYRNVYQIYSGLARKIFVSSKQRRHINNKITFLYCEGTAAIISTSLGALSRISAILQIFFCLFLKLFFICTVQWFLSIFHWTWPCKVRSSTDSNFLNNFFGDGVNCNYECYCLKKLTI